MNYEKSDLTLQCPGQEASSTSLALIQLPVSSSPGREELVLIELLINVIVDTIGLVIIQALIGAVVAVEAQSVGKHPKANDLPSIPHSLHHVVAQQVLALALLIITQHVFVPLVVAGLLEPIELIHVVSVLLHN